MTTLNDVNLLRIIAEKAAERYNRRSSRRRAHRPMTTCLSSSLDCLPKIRTDDPGQPRKRAAMHRRRAVQKTANIGDASIRDDAEESTTVSLL